MTSKKHAIMEKKHCLACGTCMIVCPMDAISIHKGYYAYADPALCVGCGKCAGECPTGCIAIVPRRMKDGTDAAESEMEVGA